MVYLSRLPRLDNFLAGQANTAYSSFILSKTDGGFLLCKRTALNSITRKVKMTLGQNMAAKGLLTCSESVS